MSRVVLGLTPHVVVWPHARRYSYSHEPTGVIVLIGMGVLFRVLTFVLMVRGKTQAARR